MKKKKGWAVLAALVMTLMIGATALAATYYEPTYCDQCGATLSTGYTPGGHYTTSHLVQTNLVDGNGNPIYANCTINHDITIKKKYCPTHGLKWSGSWHVEDHSYCSDTSYWE